MRSISEQIVDMYIEGANHKEDGWIIVLNNKNPQPSYGSGSASPDNASGWKVHMSIHKEDIEKAIPLLCGIVLNNPNRMGFKIVNALGANGGFDATQPAKQIAIIFGSEVNGDNMRQIITALDNVMREAGIRMEDRPLNSVPQDYKFDAQITYVDGARSYFGYRNDNAVVMDDALIDGNENVVKQGIGYMVKQSYYNSLPENQKHNPAGETDPFKDFPLSKGPATPSLNGWTSSTALTVGLIAVAGVVAIALDFGGLRSVCAKALEKIFGSAQEISLDK